MLKLTIKAKDYEELSRKIIDAGKELFQHSEEGWFDEGEDEWAIYHHSYTLDYEEGAPAKESRNKKKAPKRKALKPRGKNGKPVRKRTDKNRS